MCVNELRDFYVPDLPMGWGTGLIIMMSEGLGFIKCNFIRNIRKKIF